MTSDLLSIDEVVEWCTSTHAWSLDDLCLSGRSDQDQEDVAGAQ